MKEARNEFPLEHGIDLLLCEALLVARFPTGALVSFCVDLDPFPVSDRDFGFRSFVRIGMELGGLVGEVFGHSSGSV